MRTLKSLPLDDSERLKIAEEALMVYAPLAHRMGVMKVKGELEDLAFRYFAIFNTYIIYIYIYIYECIFVDR
jgi:GTP pyrophosphokinase